MRAGLSRLSPSTLYQTCACRLLPLLQARRRGGAKEDLYRAPRPIPGVRPFLYSCFFSIAADFARAGRVCMCAALARAPAVFVLPSTRRLLCFWWFRRRANWQNVLRCFSAPAFRRMAHRRVAGGYAAAFSCLQAGCGTTAGAVPRCACWRGGAAAAGRGRYLPQTAIGRRGDGATAWARRLTLRAAPALYAAVRAGCPHLLACFFSAFNMPPGAPRHCLPLACGRCGWARDSGGWTMGD